MARRQHVLSGPRSGEAEQAAFQALCHAKQEKFAAAYTACNQALQISEDLPDPTCLIVSLQALGIIQIWHGEACFRSAEIKAQTTSRARQHDKRSEEHTSELQSLMRISYAVFCLKKKKKQQHTHNKTTKP